MSRSLSWIDPEALAASLARAGVGAGYGNAKPAMGSVGVPGALSGAYAPSPGPRPMAQQPLATVTELPSTVAAAPDPPRPTPAVAAPSPSPTVAEPTTVAAAKAAAAPAAAASAAIALEPVIEAFEPPASRLHARLEAFMEWVERHVPCQEIFIVDEEGLVLMERNSDPTLIAVSSYFLNFNERIRSSLGAQSQGAIAIDLEGDRTLHVVQAETPLGPHALGFTSSQPLHRNVNESFRTTLPVVFAQDAA